MTKRTADVVAEELRDAILDCRITAREAADTAAAGKPSDYAADDAALRKALALVAELEGLAL